MTRLVLKKFYHTPALGDASPEAGAA